MATKPPAKPTVAQCDRAIAFLARSATEQWPYLRTIIESRLAVNREGKVMVELFDSTIERLKRDLDALDEAEGTP